MNEEVETNFFKSLIYVSKAKKNVDYDEILKILTHSWKYNHNSYISGMLLYDNGYFMQIIQGPIATIDRLYARISKDPRHSNIKLVGEELLPTRDCTGWGIGFYENQEVADIFYEAFDIGHGKELDNVNYADAKSLLLALKNII